MKMMEEIKLLHNSKIDIDEWDKTITASINSRIYAESWYLDSVAPDWQGLIYGNYKYVMPVAIKKKMGINYAFQPLFSQQLGVFPPPEPNIFDFFLKELASKVPYYNIGFNSLNKLPQKEKSIEWRKNHILLLDKPYDELTRAYSAHTRRHLRKAKKNCSIAISVQPSEYINLKSQNCNSGFSKEHLSKLKLLINKTTQRGRGKIYGAYNKHNELCAAAFFIFDEKRAYYLNSVSNNEGKKLQSMYAIVDKFIFENAESSLVVDFEGSTIDGIARFFKGFGASPEKYAFVKYNKLPWPLKLIKK
jgi:hypothetical protein